MTVRELLDRTDSLELSEWRAFERALGPIGREYQHETLAKIHEQLQFLCRLTGAQYEDNPAPPVERFTRPNEIWIVAEKADEESVEQQNDGGTDELAAYFD